MTDLSRRRFLAATGAATLAGVAGCSGGGDGGDGGGGDGGDGGGDVVPEAARGRVDEFLNASPAASNYDGTIVDGTGQDEVAVDVGAEGNQGNFAFAPPAVAISTGTTVSWQWTGAGGQHNVASVEDSDFDFDSGDPKQSGDPFEQSFDDAGVGLYLCEPHESLGMKGAVVVVSG